jgi:hypothetical protein
LLLTAVKNSFDPVTSKTVILKCRVAAAQPVCRLLTETALIVPLVADPGSDRRGSIGSLADAHRPGYRISGF